MEPNLEALKNKLSSFFKDHQEVIFAYLFGSAAEGRTTPLSDIDIAVSVDPAQIDETRHPYGYGAHLTSCLMGLLQTNRIDLVILNEASPTLQHQVFSRGVRVFCRDPNLERQAFVNAFHRYQNTRPLRQVQEFYLRRYLKALGSPSRNG